MACKMGLEREKKGDPWSIFREKGGNEKTPLKGKLGFWGEKGGARGGLYDEQPILSAGAHEKNS